jgi:hypothetical protein
VVEDIIMWRRWWLRNVVVWWWQRWVGIERIVHLIERRFLSLFLLTENVNGVLQFYEPYTLSIDVLPSSISPLSSLLAFS